MIRAALQGTRVRRRRSRVWVRLRSIGAQGATGTHSSTTMKAISISPVLSSPCRRAYTSTANTHQQEGHSGQHTHSVVSLDPVELPRRPRVALGVLSPDRQMHRVPPSDVAADHTLVRDVLPHLPAQVRLNLDFPETIDWRRNLRLGHGLRQRWGHVGGCCEHVWGDGGRVRGRGQEGSEGCHLRLVQVAHPTAVMDLHACTEALGGFLPDAVEVRQSMLWVGQHLACRLSSMHC